MRAMSASTPRRPHPPAARLRIESKGEALPDRRKTAPLARVMTKNYRDSASRLGTETAVDVASLAKIATHVPRADPLIPIAR